MAEAYARLLDSPCARPFVGKLPPDVPVPAEDFFRFAYIEDMQRLQKKLMGFTLVELMVTIVVVSIVLAIGIPSIAQLRRNSELVTGTNELVAALNFARSEAVRRGEAVELAPRGTWADGWTVGTNLTDANQANWNVYRQFEAPPDGVSIVTDTGPAVITFQALGDVAAVSCLEINSGERSLQLSGSGRISKQHAACP